MQNLRKELQAEGIVQFVVRARPNAPQTKVIEVLADESVKIAVKAPAEDGKANTELVRFLAEQFNVSRSAVQIVSGTKGRQKVVRIRK